MFKISDCLSVDVSMKNSEFHIKVYEKYWDESVDPSVAEEVISNTAITSLCSSEVIALRDHLNKILEDN